MRHIQVGHAHEVPKGVGTAPLLSARNVGHDDVGGVAVEILTAPVAIVAAFLLIDAFGLCITYGQLVAA
jgi:hypothetical protein